LQRSGLEALHRLEHRVFDLTQAGFRMRLTPRNKLLCNRLARGCQPGGLRSMSCSSIAAPACPIGKPDAHFTGLRKTTPGTPINFPPIKKQMDARR